MVRRVLLSLFAFLIILWLIIWLLPMHRYFPGFFGEGHAVLILFDQPDPNQEDLDRVDALMLRQLLGHFKTRDIELVSTGEYEKGDIDRYDLVFYVGTKPDLPLPTYLVDDLFYHSGKLVWMGADLSKIGSRHSLDRFGLQPIDRSDSHATNRVLYKEKGLWKTDTSTYAVKVVNQSKCEVLAWATAEVAAKVPEPADQYGAKVFHAGQPLPMESAPATQVPPLPAELNFGVEISTLPAARGGPPVIDGSVRLPWIVEGDKFWYVASNPFSHAIEGSAYLAFCDLLHDIFNSGAKVEHPAFLRIEDVHAKRIPDDLITAADFLQAEDIPFSFTLVPVYVNPATEEKYYLSNTPRFLSTVRALIARGGVPILHGYTHQNKAETGVDYEFWGGPEGGPLAEDGNFAAEIAVRGLSECFLSEVYPLAWTTPHYAASQVDYRSIRSFFTTAVERRQPIDKIGYDQFFPYMIYRDMHEQIIIPENLGYVQPDAGRDPQAILRDADNGLVVRDGWASFFFHTFLDLDLLKQITTGLEDLGYEWVNLADFNNKARTKDTVIVSGVGEIEIQLSGQYFQEFVVGKHGAVEEESYSFRPVTGTVQKYASTHKGETAVYRGTYTRPQISLGNFYKFRPTVSGLSSPVAKFLLMIGMIIMLTFMIIWIYLLLRKVAAEIRAALRRKEAAGR
jgi:uncharacterized protein YdaL